MYNIYGYRHYVLTTSSQMAQVVALDAPSLLDNLQNNGHVKVSESLSTQI
jgi:hypothetical protein